VGSSESAGGSETGANSVGWTDLVALRRGVNPAYRAAQKVFWAVNDHTLSSLDGILDKQGRPIIHPQYSPDGRRLLLGFPVEFAPRCPTSATWRLRLPSGPFPT
jgi:HK97 family phage major capsid protein